MRPVPHVAEKLFSRIPSTDQSRWAADLRAVKPEAASFGERSLIMICRAVLLLVVVAASPCGSSVGWGQAASDEAAAGYYAHNSQGLHRLPASESPEGLAGEPARAPAAACRLPPVATRLPRCSPPAPPEDEFCWIPPEPDRRNAPAGELPPEASTAGGYPVTPFEPIRPPAVCWSVATARPDEPWPGPSTQPSQRWPDWSSARDGAVGDSCLMSAACPAPAGLAVPSEAGQAGESEARVTEPEPSPDLVSFAVPPAAGCTAESPGRVPEPEPIPGFVRMPNGRVWYFPTEPATSGR